MRADSTDRHNHHQSPRFPRVRAEKSHFGHRNTRSIHHSLRTFRPTSRAYQPCIAEPNKPRDLVRQEDILEYDQSKPFSASHHTTKLKSVCVNAGFTRRIIGVLKAESDAIVDFFYSTKSPRIQAFSFGGENNDIVLFDNRVVTHAATLDFFSLPNDTLRVTPHAVRPFSVKGCGEQTGK
ncbi:taurine catabolism dioxygenase, TauD/TfdA family protein [Rhizoctonia solani AG-3 Rhs1AP]|uniref:Taurine catabolism dioxygenase, TauD/TfdA family protein n=2 Tax=Rhizoctonia solani AG-3 TaxID=1086053 RepID=A0A074RIJ6_9AGAM|nr:taurine catabolism dioxygenase, TauD/TfdA family protein [Rhizoctonia solani AG-3 Rhs1AP]KEP46931.1 taurine catabolism dioxygenase, TauD/TfdA family protein [Rhizoctonia solani 123E]